MFVLTLKSKISRKKVRLAVLCIVGVLSVLAVIIGIAVFSSDDTKAQCSLIGEYSTKFSEDNSAQEFALQFDKEIEELYSEQKVYIPDEFNSTYREYNKLQNSQGLDLEKYKGKQCTLYIYKLKNYKVDYKDTYMSILVYKEKVVAGHISTGVFGSVMYTFCGE